MASRIVKALKNAKSTLRSQEEAEIVAVVPPPQDPKKSRPPPTPPAAKLQAAPPAAAAAAATAPTSPVYQQQPSPPLSPILQKLEETTLGHDNKRGGVGTVPEFTLIAELPDTSITRPRSRDGGGSPVENRNEEQNYYHHHQPDGQKKEKDVGLGKELKEKKKKDPAVLVEIPKSPSAQAYEIAHTQKLQDQYFNPVFEDESRTPKDGSSPAPPSPEKVAGALKEAAVQVAVSEDIDGVNVAGGTK